MKARAFGFAAVALSAMALAGCSTSEKEVSQSIMPAALNYYVLTQETARLRAEVKSSEPRKLSGFLARYAEIASRGQQMLKDNAALAGLKKHQDFLACLDSSLQSQLGFLAAESRAVKAMAEYHEAREEIAKIERILSGNSLARSRYQAELDRWKEAVRQSSEALVSLRPRLAELSRLNLGQMRRYNQMVLERKILTYTASESILALFDWEHPAAPAKAASKKTKGSR